MDLVRAKELVSVIAKVYSHSFALFSSATSFFLSLSKMLLMSRHAHAHAHAHALTHSTPACMTCPFHLRNKVEHRQRSFPSQ